MCLHVAFFSPFGKQHLRSFNVMCKQHHRNALNPFLNGLHIGLKSEQSTGFLRHHHNKYISFVFAITQCELTLSLVITTVRGCVDTNTSLFFAVLQMLHNGSLIYTETGTDPCSGTGSCPQK